MSVSGSPAPPPYQLRFEQRPGYLYAFVSGAAVTLEIAKDYWLRIAEECARVKVARVLVEDDLPQQLPMTDMYELAGALPDMGFRSVRVAFVDRQQVEFPITVFGEDVAVNRGASGRVFNNFRQAEEWLLSDLHA